MPRQKPGLSEQCILPSGPFATVVADPPWSYRDKVHAARVAGVKAAEYGFGADKIRGRRGADGYYPTMTVQEIIALPVLSVVADNAHLYLWCTNAFIEQAHQISRAWGFNPRTVLTWVKPGLGMGHYYRNNTEHVVFAVRGSMPVLRKNVPTAFQSPKTRIHSEKPQVFYDIVEAMSPAPRLEMFSRRTRENWTQWGNEVGKLDRTSARQPISLDDSEIPF